MRPPQGQTAIFESEDAGPAILIAAESMRGKAHSEGGSFPSHMPGPEGADGLHHPPRTTTKGSRALLVGAEGAERISDHTLQSAARRGHGLQETYGISCGPLEPHIKVCEVTSREGRRDTAGINQLTVGKCAAFEVVAIERDSTALKGMIRIVRHSSSPIRVGPGSFLTALAMTLLGVTRRVSGRFSLVRLRTSLVEGEAS